MYVGFGRYLLKVLVGRLVVGGSVGMRVAF
jgi:hypothetical protein